MLTTKYYLRVDGIKGSSKVPRHAGEIEISSFSWGTQSNFYPGAGVGPGKVNISELSIYKEPDISSPRLKLYYDQGMPIPKMKFTVEEVSPRGEIKTVLAAEMEQVSIISRLFGPEYRREIYNLKFDKINFLKS